MPENKFKLLSHEQMIEIAKKRDSGDKAAIDKLFECNRGLAVSLAKKYFGYTYMEFEDVLQEAYIGLYEAVLNWDYTRGILFSTYATSVIKVHIWSSLIHNSTLLHVPEHKLSKALKLKLYIAKYQALYQKMPTPEEIATEIKISKKEIDDYMKIISLMQYERIGCEECQSKDRSYFNDVLIKITLQELFNTLNEFEKTIVEKRFGFNAENKCYSLEETALFCGCGREKIRYTQKEIINKFKRIIDMSDLTEVDFI